MKSNRHEQAAWEAFQERLKDTSREAVLKRLFGAQQQATLSAHQIGAFPEAGQTAGGPACLCQAAHRPHRPGEISDQHAQMFLQQVLGEQTFRGEPDHGAQGPALEKPDGKTIEEEDLIQKGGTTMTKQQGQQEPVDQLYFDGSAEPNPGGRMGAGWRLVFTDRPEETGSAEWPAARDNTNNRAEYLALIGALEQYLASGRSGPLQVQGDSQLVINQMTGDWGINNPALWQLNQQATARVLRIAGGVRYRWIPREENQVADTLAGGQLAQAGTPLVFAEHLGGATVAAALAEQIARLNQAGKMSFKEALGLRVGGMDQYSRWHLQALVTAVGAAGVALIDAAFPGPTAEAIKAQETALRWMVRGLAAQLAIRKVQVDLELQANRRPGRAT